AGRPRWARPRRARPAEETLGRIRQDPRGAAPRPSPRPPLQERDKRGVVLHVVEVNDCDEFPAGAPPVIEDLLGPPVSAQVEARLGVVPPRRGPAVARTAGGSASPWTTPSRSPPAAPGAAPRGPGPGGDGHLTSAMSSTSTGASSGSTATPTALRACFPASPNTSTSSSLAPLTTCGWPVKPGALATKPTTLTIRTTDDRSPTTDLT